MCGKCRDFALVLLRKEEEEVALGRCWCVSMNTTFRTHSTRVGMRGEA